MKTFSGSRLRATGRGLAGGAAAAACTAGITWLARGVIALDTAEPWKIRVTVAWVAAGLAAYAVAGALQAFRDVRRRVRIHPAGIEVDATWIPRGELLAQAEMVDAWGARSLHLVCADRSVLLRDLYDAPLERIRELLGPALDIDAEIARERLILHAPAVVAVERTKKRPGILLTLRSGEKVGLETIRDEAAVLTLRRRLNVNTMS